MSSLFRRLRAALSIYEHGSVHTPASWILPARRNKLTGDVKLILLGNLTKCPEGWETYFRRQSV